MNDMTPARRALFAKARDDLAPDDGDRMRVERALAARLGIAVGAMAAGAATATATNAAAGTGTGASAAGGLASGGVAAAGGKGTVGVAVVAMKWLAATAVVGGLGAGGVEAYRYGVTAPSAPVASVATPSLASSGSRPDARPRVVSSIPPREPSFTSAPVPERLHPPMSSTPSVLQPTRSKRTAQTTTPAVGVAEEARVMREAHAAIKAGDGVRALALLDEHARAFPGGVLTNEGEALRVSALCMVGRVDAAHAAAERFLRAYPGSPLAASVRSSCGGR